MDARRELFKTLDALPQYRSGFDHDLMFMHHYGKSADIGVWFLGPFYESRHACSGRTGRSTAVADLVSQSANIKKTAARKFLRAAVIFFYSITYGGTPSGIGQV